MTRSVHLNVGTTFAWERKETVVGINLTDSAQSKVFHTVLSAVSVDILVVEFLVSEHFLVASILVAEPLVGSFVLLVGSILSRAWDRNFLEEVKSGSQIMRQTLLVRNLRSSCSARGSALVRPSEAFASLWNQRS